MWTSLKKNWRIYLIEAWALGMFMLSAGIFSILLFNKALPLSKAIDHPLLQRFFMGLAMGATAVLLIYSKWGKRSGAHMNPAVTLSNLQLHRIAVPDAFWYILAQFVGGIAGIGILKLVVPSWIAAPEVNYAVTVPGPQGFVSAFFMEALLSFGLFLLVLVLSNWPKLQAYTGYFVGCLLVLYITFEAPISGMSMNPARTFASAFVANVWTAWYLYFIAPVLGMNLAGYLYREWYRRQHHGNCLTMQCFMSGQKHQHATYKVSGPKWVMAKFSQTI